MLKRLLTIFCVLSAMPTILFASTIQLAETGQTSCYDSVGNLIPCVGTLQDGEIKAGGAWPLIRFTDNGDQTMTDNLTGLIWTKDANAPGPAACTPGVKKNWQDALDYAACLNTNNYLGYSDWRLPNRREQLSLINREQTQNSIWLGDQGFANVQFERYWSSSTNTGFPNNALSISIDGHLNMVSSTKSTLCNVWAVRTGQSSGAVQLAQTGQTTCYNDTGSVISCVETGQDGETQSGTAWPAPRFSDNGDQTMTDGLTGLVWTKEARTPGPSVCNPGTSKSREVALGYADCLNANNFLGYNDWRLPNIVELESLTNVGEANGATWLQGQGFSNVQQGAFYWSSTTGQSRYYQMAARMQDGSVYVSTSNSYIWPVRNTQNSVLTVNKIGAGTGNVTPDSGTLTWNLNTGTANYSEDATVVLTATPDVGNTFAGWDGGDCSGTGTCSIALGANTSVKATFLPNYALTVTMSGKGTGTVNSDVTPDINCSTGSCAQEYAAGTVVTLTATPDAGSTFSRWGGACSGSGICQVTMDAIKDVDARFK